MNKIRVKDFSLKHSLECGQVFRWHKIMDSFYYGFIEGKPVKIMQDGNKLYYDSYKGSVCRDSVKEYFGLNERIGKILREINVDDAINEAIENLYGLRIIKQDPFECLVSYISSPRTRIQQITKAMDLLSYYAGKKMDFDEGEFYSFPKLNDLLGFDHCFYKDKCNLKTSIMARQLQKTLQKISEEKKEFRKLHKKDYWAAKEYLLDLPGVGHKVADCVCLFSLKQYQAFPVDTWIKKIMSDFYFEKRFSEKPLTSKEYLEIANFGMEKFGKYAGIAQEYLYYHFRKK